MMKPTCVSALLIFFLLTLALFIFACEDVEDDADDKSSGDDTDDENNDDSTDDDDNDDNNDDDAQCEQGELKCSDDTLQLLECNQGQWGISSECMRDFGQLCENAACVDPWKYGSPEFDPCEDDPNATTKSLTQKAAHYDEVASRLHLHPDHKRIHHVTLPAGLTESNGTYDDVIDWHTGENDGLWSALYLTSQAFRYAVTGEAAALDNLRVLMDGMRISVDVTGVSGLFTREYITPNLQGMSCPADPMEYVPDPEKDDNQWVKVDDDGTILVYDPNQAQFVQTSHKVSADFAGYCWLDNVSQDEYAGHMAALGAVYELVDDPQVRAEAEELLEEISAHLMENDMAFVDWDGRVTEHGRFWILALTDFPGFNALMGLNMIKQGAIASGRQDLLDYYADCLLQQSGQSDCIDQYLTPPMAYDEWLWFMGLYIGPRSCKSNWNNMSMAFCHMFTLVWFEHDAQLRTAYQKILEDTMFRFKTNPRTMAEQHNGAWAMMYASMKNVLPGSTGQDIDAVNDAICALRQFPESKTMIDLDVGEAEYPTDLTCESRFDGRFLTFDPIPVHQRCPKTFTWWSNPYRHQTCTANEQYVLQPADYLLPYWMARYFGYVDETM